MRTRARFALFFATILFASTSAYAGSISLGIGLDTANVRPGVGAVLSKDVVGTYDCNAASDDGWHLGCWGTENGLRKNRETDFIGGKHFACFGGYECRADVFWYVLPGPDIFEFTPGIGRSYKLAGGDTIGWDAQVQFQTWLQGHGGSRQNLWFTGSYGTSFVGQPVKFSMTYIHSTVLERDQIFPTVAVPFSLGKFGNQDWTLTIGANVLAPLNKPGSARETVPGAFLRLGTNFDL